MSKNTRNYEMTYETREEKDEQEKQHYIITGRPVVYNSKTNLGYFYEIIERGALDNTDLTDVLFFVNHNTEKIALARSRRNNANSTLQLTIDENGLLFRADLDCDNNTEARSLYSAIKRGDLDGMSFGFYIDTEEWEDLESETPTRKIKSIAKIVEISAVNHPAYEDTSIVISKRDKEALDNAKASLENEEKTKREQEKKKAVLEFYKLKNRLI